MLPIEEPSSSIHNVDPSSKKVLNIDGMALVNIVHKDKYLNIWMVKYVFKTDTLKYSNNLFILRDVTKKVLLGL